METPYEILVYDKAYSFKGWLHGPTEVKAVVRHNALSTASIVVDADHDRVDDLNAEGARVVIYRNDEYLVGGPVRLVGGQGPNVVATLTFGVEDDFRLLHRLVALPVPGGTVAANGTIQGQTVEYYSASGPAETVLKQVVAANLPFYGITDVTVAPTLGRGASIQATLRMHPIYDRLFPAVDIAGVGVTVRQVGTKLILDCYTPKVIPLDLSEESGTLVDWSYTTSAPTVTDVIVGGQGEGTARTFKYFRDSPRAADWNDRIVAVQDARDTAVGDIYQVRAMETLADGAPMSGLSLTLSDTEFFRYGGNGVHVGDLVTARIGTLTITDVLREARFSWTADKGDEVTPIVGERTDDPSTLLGRALRRLFKADNDRKAR